jgi:lipoate-protein ligase A
VSIGYFQQHASGAETGLAVVRRPSGGGLVRHGPDVTYTLAIPPGHWWLACDREESYRRAARAVTHGLAAVGIDTETATSDVRSRARGDYACFSEVTAYDLVKDGCKVAGAAQRRSREGLLHQGSVDGSMAPAGEVTEAVLDGFAATCGCRWQRFTPSADFLATADVLAAERYAPNTDWDRRR